MNLQWRWTATPISVGGFHGSIMAFFPLLIATGLSRYTFGAGALYFVYLIYCRGRNYSPWQMMQFLHVKYIVNGRWPAF